MLLLLYIQNNPLEEEVQVKNVTLFAKMNYFILNSRALVASFYYNLELYIAFKMRFIDDRFFVPNELKNHNLCYWHALNFKTVNGVFFGLYLSVPYRQTYILTTHHLLMHV